MPKFFPLYVRRSDGKIDLVNKQRLKERNEPTREQLDKSPDANGICDYYRDVDMDEQKHLDWRRKLGGMLARDLGVSDSERGYMLAAFPENYRLYEHVKRAVDDAKGAKSLKNHAGGGNDRQDAYLYGHPQGRKKRYRSPADFYPHLLWLCTDEKGDPDNCSCKICCPDEIEEKAAAPVKKVPVIEIERASQPLTTPSSASSNSVAPASSRSSTSNGGMSVAAIPTRVAPLTEDHKLDLSYGAYIYREGELVWFARGQAWGLGVVSRRAKATTSPGASPASRYTVQPLSHPYQHPQAVILQEHELRPWLAWSVPGYTHSALNSIPGLAYNRMDWQALNRGDFGSGDMEVDGSILAARRIDSSLSPFEPTLTATITAETSHQGVYVGAERVWVGDVVRYHNQRVTDILVIKRIVSRASQNGPTRTITLHGDMYTLSQVSTTDTNNVLPLKNNAAGLPNRVKEDLRLRNSTSIAAKGIATIYELATIDATISTREIKGRWYEASLLAPLLLGQQQADSEKQQGTVTEMGLRMNARLECGRGSAADASSVQEAFHEDRRTTLGHAVPATFTLGRRPTGQPEQSKMPLQGATQGFGNGPDVQMQDHDGNAGFDELMNLDG